MSLLRYPEYKSTGAEWLREVPSHWDVQPCRAVVTECTEKNDGATNQNYLSLMANIGVIPYEEKGDVGNKKPEDLSKCKLVSKGDLVINSMNYGIGSYGLSELYGVCSPVYIVLRPILERVRARFIFRVFENKAFQTYAQSFGNGILEHRAAINWDILKSVSVGVPPLDEQEAILNFLDRETAKIDALIAEQEKLLTLLAEKRQATISYAVTRGLNPDVPMKDSGVAWLGEVPAHWEVKPIGYFCQNISYGFTNPMPTTEEGPYLLTANDVGMGYINYDSARRTSLDAFHSELTDKSRPQPGDVLITKDGTLGRVALFDGGMACINQSVASIRLEPRVVQPDFIAIALSGGAYQERMVFDAGGTTIKHIYISRLAKMPMAIPPLVEQTEILVLLGEEMRKLSALANEAERAIELLKERRSALISAAVTGQIDVREAVAEEVAA